MRRASLCFIGAGFQATTNIYPSVVEAGIEIKAIATRNKKNSKATLVRFGSEGNAYDNIDEMLKNEECDGVVIVAQPEDMSAMVIKCIEAGKNVFAEKPLGLTAIEAKDLSDRAERAGVILMVGFMKRYAPSYLKLKELIASKELGNVKSFNVDFAVNSTEFCKSEEDYLKLAAIHIVDLMRYLFGEAIGVSGFKSIEGSNLSQSISLKFESGTVGSAYFVGMDAWSRERENILVTFEKGFISIEEITKIIIHKSRNAAHVSWQSQTEEDTILTPSATPMSGAYRDLYLRGFVGELAHFAEKCLSGETPKTSGEDNVKTMELIELILSELN